MEEAEPERGEGIHYCHCYHRNHDVRKLSASSTVISRMGIAMHVGFPANPTVRVNAGFSADSRAARRWVGAADRI